MDTSSNLGEFLRLRRAAVDPDRAGIRSINRRRVPGLRREEVAMLAGVSVAYYTRLEQGKATNAPDEVLLAIARRACRRPRPSICSIWRTRVSL